MITHNVKKSDYDSRKEYLVALAMAYLREHGEDTMFYDEAECDGYCLADDLGVEFNIILT